MNKYQIYCTEDQTKKAFELGAPLIRYNCYIHRFVNPCGIGKECYIVPTAEQMIGWIEERLMGSIDITLDNPPIKWKYEVWNKNFTCYECEEGFASRKDVTRAAINAALEYLSNKSK